MAFTSRTFARGQHLLEHCPTPRTITLYALTTHATVITSHVNLDHAAACRYALWANTQTRAPKAPEAV